MREEGVTAVTQIVEWPIPPRSGFTDTPHIARVIVATDRNATTGPRVVCEWELSNYRPELQQLDFRESSTFYHVWINRMQLLPDVELVGFFQYDMVLGRHSFRNIQEQWAECQGKNKDMVLFQSLNEESWFRPHWCPSQDVNR